MTAKVLTTIGDRAEGVLEALAASGIDPHRVGDFIHGTTAATNAVIEGTTAPTALITTTGFRDALELMRGDRPMPVYDINWRKPDPLIPRNRRFEVPERLDADGAVVTPLDEGAVRTLLSSDALADCEAVAVCFLHSFLDGVHERRVAELAAEERPGPPRVALVRRESGGARVRAHLDGRARRHAEADDDDVPPLAGATPRGARC